MTANLDLNALAALEQATPDAYQDDAGRVWLNLRKHPDGWPGAYDFDSSCSPLALTPTATVAHLARWKAEALPVMSGLQELGRALGVPLGKSITARESVDLALDLHNRATAAEAEVAALRERVGQAANEIEAKAEDEKARTSRSFHPQGTHADGRRDGCWEGRMDAARIIRAALTTGDGRG